MIKEFDSLIKHIAILIMLKKTLFKKKLTNNIIKKIKKIIFR